MRTTYLKTTAISLCLVAFLLSCNKQDEIINQKTALLIQQSWKFEKYGLDENNNGTIEASENTMLGCEADDTYTFFANGSGFYEGGALPCSQGETPIINFNWRFENNATELAVFAAPEKINQLDEKILEVYYMDVNTQGQPVKFIRRFQH